MCGSEGKWSRWPKESCGFRKVNPWPVPFQSRIKTPMGWLVALIRLPAPQNTLPRWGRVEAIKPNDQPLTNQAPIRYQVGMHKPLYTTLALPL